MKSLSKNIVPLGTVNAPTIAVVGNTDTGIYFPTTNSMAIAINGQQVVLIDSTGLSAINDLGGGTGGGTVSFVGAYDGGTAASTYAPSQHLDAGGAA
jgi:hypothetical protein